MSVLLSVLLPIVKALLEVVAAQLMQVFTAKDEVLPDVKPTLKYDSVPADDLMRRFGGLAGLHASTEE